MGAEADINWSIVMTALVVRLVGVFVVLASLGLTSEQFALLGRDFSLSPFIVALSLRDDSGSPGPTL